MDALFSLIAATLGVLAGLIGGFFTGRQQARLEFEKWQRSREDDVAKELRLAVAELMRHIATTTQEIAWFTWKAKYQPEQITSEVIAQYDMEMKSLFPAMDGDLIIISALSEGMYQKMKPLVNEVYKLEGGVAKAAITFSANSKDAVQAIAHYQEQAVKFKDELNLNVANLIAIQTKQETRTTLKKER